ncbi:hypothetical protein Cpap_3995 [Ruminiclostridium papyrosolvens DSM 2782]|uniref:Uncharacterized protein n=2 Tax=Ruminiclostridium papyrosolvens TaxID=29362 RepID=F1T7W1_9FIRM|nr:hypothetical protein Cpap_3995 [Ruminiclostridium papyrosolvens DSM 2782]
MTKITQIKNKYVEAYQAIGMSLEEAVSGAIQNLKKLDHRKNYTIMHDCNRESCIDVPIVVHGVEQYAVGGIDETDVINFALQLYLPIARLDRFKRLLKDKLSEKVFFDMLEQLGIEVADQETDEEKGRVYAYTNCPLCGARRFYFSWDQVRQNIFAGCYDPVCKMHYVMDIITFVQKNDGVGYKEAVLSLTDILQQITGETKENESSIITTIPLEYCEIKKEAKFCIVVTVKADLLTVCQFMQSESIILIEQHQMPFLKDIIASIVPSEQILILLCETSQCVRYELDAHRTWNGDREVIVKGLPEERHVKRLLGLTAVKLLANEFSIRK